MYIELHFNSYDVKPEELPKALAALAHLLEATAAGKERPSVFDNFHVDPPVAPAAPQEVTTAEVVVEAKPKRKRRTKAEIQAGKDAEEAVEAPAPVAEVPAPVAEAPAPVAEAITEERVRDVVVAAVERLKDGGDEKAPLTVITKITELTGKKRVGEVSVDQYPVVIAALDLLGL